MDGCDGAEEAVRLQYQLPAQVGFIVHQQRLDAALPQLDCRRHPGGAAAQDEHGHGERFDLAQGRGLRQRRQRGQALNRLDAHTRRHRRHARLDGFPIRQHQALRALPVRAEDALRRTVFGMVAEDTDAVGKKR